jgi:hypothetical protein
MNWKRSGRQRSGLNEMFYLRIFLQRINDKLHSGYEVSRPRIEPGTSHVINGVNFHGFRVCPRTNGRIGLFQTIVLSSCNNPARCQAYNYTRTSVNNQMCKTPAPSGRLACHAVQFSSILASVCHTIPRRLEPQPKLYTCP